MRRRGFLRALCATGQVAKGVTMGRQRRWISPRGATRRQVDALIVGHITRDLLADGSWRPGGAAFYAAAAAQRFGLRVGVVTSAPADLCAVAVAALGDVALVAVASEAATTFENVYTPAGRVQYVRALAQPITLDDIPRAWRRCDIALLAPVARECVPALAYGLTARVSGAAPQGWLRQWGEDGRVRPRLLGSAERDALRAFSALILSHEDLTGPTSDAASLAEAAQTLAQWSQLVPLIAVTRGPEGADLWRGGDPTRFPGYPAREVDPTGAGDIFAATFLCALARDGDPARAMDQANRVAALAVEGVGVAAIPTPSLVATRFPHERTGG